MHALEVIIVRNAAAAGREAAHADNDGAHEKASVIFEADSEARRELAEQRVSLQLSNIASDAFVGAYCNGRVMKKVKA